MHVLWCTLECIYRAECLCLWNRYFLQFLFKAKMSSMGKLYPLGRILLFQSNFPFLRNYERFLARRSRMSTFGLQRSLIALVLKFPLPHAWYNLTRGQWWFPNGRFTNHFFWLAHALLCWHITPLCGTISLQLLASFYYSVGTSSCISFQLMMSFKISTNFVIFCTNCQNNCHSVFGYGTANHC